MHFSECVVSVGCNPVDVVFIFQVFAHKETKIVHHVHRCYQIFSNLDIDVVYFL